MSKLSGRETRGEANKFRSCKRKQQPRGPWDVGSPGLYEALGTKWEGEEQGWGSGERRSCEGHGRSSRDSRHQKASWSRLSVSTGVVVYVTITQTKSMVTSLAMPRHQQR